MMTISRFTYCVFIILVCIYCIHGNSVYFGKFKVKLMDLEKCKGPKRSDCGTIDWTLEDGNLIHYTYVAPENIAPLRANIKVSTNGKGLVRLQMKKICDNAFMKPFFKIITNITEDCVVLKGSYKLTVDIEKVIQKYYAGEFFYGNVTIYSVLHNNDCNFSCATLKVMLLPKD